MPSSDPFFFDGFAQGISKHFVSLLAPVGVTLFATVWYTTFLPSLSGKRVEYPQPIEENPSSSNNWSDNDHSIVESLSMAFFVVVFITLVTFFILALYKCGCFCVLYGWLMYSCASLLLVMTWLWMNSVLSYFDLRYTSVSMAFFVWNFGLVGVISVVYYAHPFIRQFYLIFASLIMIDLMVELPASIAWALLLAIASYDIVAVLCPFGPLRLLVEESNRRVEPLPGFVYDSDRSINPVTHSRAAIAPIHFPVRSKLVQRLSSVSPGKLGLGDFIFYGLLVGKASQYGFIEWTFCFIAILLGMVGTFLVLICCHFASALPALPISIFLATFVCFASLYSVSSASFYSTSRGLLL